MMNKVNYLIFYEINSALHNTSTDNIAMLTVLLAKHITSCDNVFKKKDISYSQTMECSALFIQSCLG